MDPEFAEDVQRAAAIAGSSRLSAYLRIPGDGFPRLCSGRRRKRRQGCRPSGRRVRDQL